MSDSTFFVSEAAVRNFKKLAAARIKGVSSAHLSEGIAAALGFRTHAALKAALTGRATAIASKPSNARLAQRLRQLGYSRASDEMRVVPELDRSYTPFRTYPLRKKGGVRWSAWRNLIVAAVNAGLDQRQFGLSPDQNWWPGAASESRQPNDGIYRFVLDGTMPAVASVGTSGGDELSIHVVLNPKSQSVLPDQYDGFSDGDAHARCWLERRLGAWIQDGNIDLSCRRDILPRIAEMDIVPNGFADQGSFFF